MLDALAQRVVQASPGEYALSLGIAVVVGLVALYRLLGAVHRIRIVEDTPTSRVRSAAQGYVELIGTGRLMEGDPIHAPLTGALCTWYSFRVEREVRGRRRNSWRTVRSGTSDELFLLDDDTGTCVIDPEGADVTPMETDVWYGSSPHWHGPARSGFSLGIGNRYRFTERRMHPGDPLYAIGWFRSVGGGNELPDTREELRQLLAAWKRDPERMRRFDADGNGVIDVQEWEGARAAARREVARAQAERASRSPVHMLSRPEEARYPFILSVLPQDRVLRRLRWTAAVAFVALVAGAGAALWLLAVR